MVKFLGGHTYTAIAFFSSPVEGDWIIEGVQDVTLEIPPTHS